MASGLHRQFSRFSVLFASGQAARLPFQVLRFFGDLTEMVVKGSWRGLFVIDLFVYFIRASDRIHFYLYFDIKLVQERHESIQVIVIVQVTQKMLHKNSHHLVFVKTYIKPNTENKSPPPSTLSSNHFGQNEHKTISGGKIPRLQHALSLPDHLQIKREISKTGDANH